MHFRKTYLHSEISYSGSVFSHSLLRAIQNHHVTWRTCFWVVGGSWSTLRKPTRLLRCWWGRLCQSKLVFPYHPPKSTALVRTDSGCWLSLKTRVHCWLQVGSVLWYFNALIEQMTDPDAASLMRLPYIWGQPNYLILCWFRKSVKTTGN